MEQSLQARSWYVVEWTRSKRTKQLQLSFESVLLIEAKILKRPELDKMVKKSIDKDVENEFANQTELKWNPRLGINNFCYSTSRAKYEQAWQNETCLQYWTSR